MILPSTSPSMLRYPCGENASHGADRRSSLLKWSTCAGGVKRLASANAPAGVDAGQLSPSLVTTSVGTVTGPTLTPASEPAMPGRCSLGPGPPLVTGEVSTI